MSSNDYRIDALANEQSRWNKAQDLGSATVITYSFSETLPDYFQETWWGIKDFKSFSDQARIATREILTAFSEMAGLRFEETDHSAAMQFMMYSGRNGIPAGIASDAEAFLPSDTGLHAGDVMINHTSEKMQDFTSGSVGYWILAHEIGHTLGLKHPGQYSGFDEGPFLPGSEDNRANTIMSYNDTHLSTLKAPFDQLALQYLYGEPAISGQLVFGQETYTYYGASRSEIMGTSHSEYFVLPRVWQDTYSVDGAAGTDTVSFKQNYSGLNRDQFIVTSSDSGVTVGLDGVQFALAAVERIEFDDGQVAFDLDGSAGQTYRLYQAAFDRTPDDIGLSHNVNLMDNGLSILEMASAFIGSEEFQKTYGTNVDNTAFLTLLYQNVLDRGPDDDGLTGWLSLLDGGTSREEVLFGFSESAENKANVASAIDDGIWLV
ncbi:uncharacterized protein DUF4214 [Roseibium hamelinense]|uniref:Uncharacterized protein DUF4214 n=1 Tax=Roseibium hamelinense TaxID=150831 RepID=A0A562TG27_9HYPH|nr:DUF4214 domain-containing protein [Roseibium hamelinense]MTI42468.1 DUF4214 domain-containing protein [Roseibium hamelinense]TWI92501.1 uncharacterized protein DUF4214 [Roseibium hamelinense]